uniref:Rootletin-like coiled-coil domain-containing protein n=1 Tax=Pygocentrus nattereri TaxID=42514 RepID=A0A3B4BKW2_PYGNA
RLASPPGLNIRLAQQNVDLRRRLEEEQAAYKRKLTAYQEGQQRQAQLVQKLQAKVRARSFCLGCAACINSIEKQTVNVSVKVCVYIFVCVSRSSSLSAVNAMLREQLEQAGLANEALSQDIRRLTADWTKAREELEQREADWRREEESFHNYFSSEHSRLLALWRQVVGFRRGVCELKSATERLETHSHYVQLQCVGVCVAVRSREDGSALVLEREAAQRSALEQQLRDRVSEMMNLQAKSDSERAELNSRSAASQHCHPYCSLSDQPLKLQSGAQSRNLPSEMGH